MEDEVGRAENHEDLKDDLDPDDISREDAVPGEFGSLEPIDPVGPRGEAAGRNRADRMADRVEEVHAKEPEPEGPGHDVAGIDGQDELGRLGEVREKLVVMALGEIKLQVVAVAQDTCDDKDEADAADELHESPVEHEDMGAIGPFFPHEISQGVNGVAGGRVAAHRLEESLGKAKRGAKFPTERDRDERKGAGNDGRDPDQEKKQGVFVFAKALLFPTVDEEKEKKSPEDHEAGARDHEVHPANGFARIESRDGDRDDGDDPDEHHEKAEVAENEAITLGRSPAFSFFHGSGLVADVGKNFLLVFLAADNEKFVLGEKLDLAVRDDDRIVPVDGRDRSELREGDVHDLVVSDLVFGKDRRLEENDLVVFEGQRLDDCFHRGLVQDRLPEEISRRNRGIDAEFAVDFNIGRVFDKGNDLAYPEDFLGKEARGKVVGIGIAERDEKVASPDASVFKDVAAPWVADEDLDVLGLEEIGRVVLARIDEDRLVPVLLEKVEKISGLERPVRDGDLHFAASFWSL